MIGAALIKNRSPAQNAAPRTAASGSRSSPVPGNALRREWFGTRRAQKRFPRPCRCWAQDKRYRLSHAGRPCSLYGHSVGQARKHCAGLRANVRSSALVARPMRGLQPICGRDFVNPKGSRINLSPGVVSENGFLEAMSPAICRLCGVFLSSVRHRYSQYMQYGVSFPQGSPAGMPPRPDASAGIFACGCLAGGEGTGNANLCFLGYSTKL